MDIVRSIDFDSLGKIVHDLPQEPPKGHEIDINRQFDLYTTTTKSFPSDAPPVYQRDDGALTIISPQSDTLESFKPSSAPKYILKTINQPPTQPWDIEANYFRGSSQVSGSSQHSKVVPVPKVRDPLSCVHFGHENVGRQDAQENTIHCEMSVPATSIVGVDLLT